MKRTVLYLLWLVLILEVGSRVLVLEPQISGFNRIYFTPLMVDKTFHNTQSNSSKIDVEKTTTRLPIYQQRILWISDPDKFEFVQSLNLYGFRGPTFPLSKTKNRKRVVFLGDSFMEGFGADDEHTIPKLVEKLSIKEIESINLGVGAASFEEYAAVAQISMPLLQPDVAILTIYQNDLPAKGFDITKSLYASIPRPIIESNWQSRFFKIIDSILKNIALPTRFYQRATAFFRPVPDTTNPLVGRTFEELKTQTKAEDSILNAALKGRFNPYLIGAPRSVEESLKLDLNRENGAIQYLQAIKASVDAIGAKLLIVYIPNHVTVSDYYYSYWNELGEDFHASSLTGPEFRKQQEHLRVTTNTLGIDYLDTTSQIQEIESKGIHLYHKYDSHMNADGYQEVAKIINSSNFFKSIQ